MKRFTSVLFGLALVGCGGGTMPPKGDMATSGGQDLAMSGGQDLAMQQGANTGEPCTKAADCGGTRPTCITKDPQGTVWPGGYCTSTCNPTKNDPDGLNSACPGGNGTCVGQGTMGACETACTEMMGPNPCTRMGYSCWTNGCEPTSRSECNPTMKGSCPQDGGVFLDDAGTYSGRVCGRFGSDDVGFCEDGCDVFKQNCPPDQGAQPGCYASFDTGEGACTAVVGGGMDGTACMYLNSCDPGFGCQTEGNMGVCRKYCGGPGNVACPMGQMCKDLTMTVPKATVGLCSK